MRVPSDLVVPRPLLLALPPVREAAADVIPWLGEPLSLFENVDSGEAGEEVEAGKKGEPSDVTAALVTAGVDDAATLAWAVC